MNGVRNETNSCLIKRWPGCVCVTVKEDLSFQVFVVERVVCKCEYERWNETTTIWFRFNAPVFKLKLKQFQFKWAQNGNELFESGSIFNYKVALAFDLNTNNWTQSDVPFFSLSSCMGRGITNAVIYWSKSHQTSSLIVLTILNC